MPAATGGAAEDLPDLVEEAMIQPWKVMPFGLDKTINMRDLDPADIDKLISVKGLVIRQLQSSRT